MQINKKCTIFTAVLIFVVMTLPGCWSGNESKSKSFYVINVLDKANFDDCRIAGSINVPFEEITKFAQGINKDAEIVLYCANYMCTSSGQAAVQLGQMGFTKVWAYEGGTAEWYQMKDQTRYPLEGACKASYLNAPNNKPEEHDTGVPVICAQELYEKMVAHGMLAKQK